MALRASSDCPSCGQPLLPTALAPEHAPWLCADCHLGFYAAELTREARSHFRRPTRDFGPGYRTHVRDAVRREREERTVRHHIAGG